MSSGKIYRNVNYISNGSFELFNPSNQPVTNPIPTIITNYLDDWTILQFNNNNQTVLDNSSIWQYPRSVDGSYVMLMRGCDIYQSLKNIDTTVIYQFSFYASPRNNISTNPVQLRINIEYDDLGITDNIFDKFFSISDVVTDGFGGTILQQYIIEDFEFKSSNAILHFLVNDIFGDEIDDKDVFIDKVELYALDKKYTGKPFNFLKCTDLYYQENSCDNYSLTKQPKKAFIFNKQSTYLTKSEILKWASRNKYR